MKLIYIFKVFILLAFISFPTISYLFHPFQVKGNAGRFKNNQLILTHSVKIPPTNIKKGTGIIFEKLWGIKTDTNKKMLQDNVGEVIGVPGDSLNNLTPILNPNMEFSYKTAEMVENTIPSGYYLVLDGPDTLSKKLVPLSLIKYIGW